MPKSQTGLVLYWNDCTYSIDPPRDLKVSQLRQIESWYPTLNSLAVVDAGLQLGDPDTLASVLWAVQRNAGESPSEPRNLDFSVPRLHNGIVSVAKERCEKCEGWGWTGPGIATFDWDGREFTYDLRDDLTAKRLRRIKAWFPKLSTLYAFNIGTGQGNADATASLLWLVRDKAGDPSSENNAQNGPDFSIGILRDAIREADTTDCEACEGRGWFVRETEEKEPDPLALSTPLPTSQPLSDTSTGTPTSSGTSSSAD